MARALGNPQNRVEAILENMLGASNELQPPQTRVEELLMEILEQGGGGGTEPVVKYKGVTTTPISDGSTTNPVEINGELITAETGDFVAYNGAEFIWNGTAWQELGDLELVAAIMTSIAPTYAGSETYNIRDRVYYNDVLYECIDDNVTGEFNPTKWDEVSVTQVLSELENDIELISSDIQAVFEMISDTYETTSTYGVGDLVIYNKKFYRCNTADTTGTWDESKWDETSVAIQLSEIRSSISNLTEVVNGLINDDSISADTTWSSSKIDSEITDRTAVTKTAEGNPITFSDGADAPMVRCETEIQGSQDLHGYDKPWVGGAGKNKLPLVLADIKALNTSGTWSDNVYTYNDITFTVNTDDVGNITGIKVNGTASNQAYLSVGNTPINGQYIINGCPQGGDYSNGYSMYITGIYIQDVGSGSTFTVTNTSYEVRILVRSGTVCNNLMFYPMIRLATETDPTFAPYSNICPITAYTEGEIEVRGRNLANHTLTTWANAPSIVLNAGIYTISIDTALSNQNWYISAKKASNVYCTKSELNLTSWTESSISGVYFGGTSTRGFTFTIPENGVSVKIGSPGSNGKPVMLERGSVMHDYEPYTSTTYTTTYPSAIYRGSEDCVDGTETHDMECIDLGDLTWVREPTAIPDLYRFYAPLTNVKTPATSAQIANILCSGYETVSADYTYLRRDGIAIKSSGAVSIYDANYNTATAEAFAVAIAGIQLAYELAAPTTSPVTPTNLPIKSLSGYNHIESSTGEMEVEYITSEYQPLVDLIESNSGKHVYSTEEQVVGTWIDGSDVYEKTIVFPTPVSVSTSFESCGIDSTNILNVVGVFGTHEDGTGYGDMMADPGLTSHTLLGLKASTSHTVKTLILQYTKTTT